MATPHIPKLHRSVGRYASEAWSSKLGWMTKPRELVVDCGCVLYIGVTRAKFMSCHVRAGRGGAEYPPASTVCTVCMYDTQIDTQPASWDGMGYISRLRGGYIVTSLLTSPRLFGIDRCAAFLTAEWFTSYLDIIHPHTHTTDIE